MPFFQIETVITVPANHDRGSTEDRQKIRDQSGVPYDFATRAEAEAYLPALREHLGGTNATVEVIEIEDVDLDAALEAAL